MEGPVGLVAGSGIIAEEDRGEHPGRVETQKESFQAGPCLKGLV